MSSPGGPACGTRRFRGSNPLGGLSKNLLLGSSHPSWAWADTSLPTGRRAGTRRLRGLPRVVQPGMEGDGRRVPTSSQRQRLSETTLTVCFNLDPPYRLAPSPELPRQRLTSVGGVAAGGGGARTEPDHRLEARLGAFAGRLKHPGGQERHRSRWAGGRGGQGNAGIALISASAAANASRQGQRFGRCSVHWRAVRVSLPGIRR